MKRIIGAFNRHVRRHALLGRGDAVIAAVSGGPDSVAMLRLLCIARSALGFSLRVAHANHALRGRASDADESFVRRLSARMGVPFHSKKISVKRRREGAALSPEEAARLARYDFLVSAARRFGASKIATAHTQDDQAETVLMRLLRGAGPRGLSAIPVRRFERGVWIVRPMMALRKKDALDFLKSQKLSYRTDATNDTDVFFRNRVRRRLLPLLRREYSPRIDLHLAELGRAAGEMYDYTAGQAARLFERCARKSGGSVALGAPALRAAHPALRSEIFFLAVESLLGDRRGLEKAHLEALEALLDAKPGSAAHLPKGLTARREARCIRLERSRRR